MKLKTLKDLPLLDCIKEMLKREAIKWVKEIEETLQKGLAVPRPDEILKSFFNITEEDLK